MSILTYLDAGVLIWFGKSDNPAKRLTALNILAAPNREFIASRFLKLELLTQPLYFGREKELRDYQVFFNAVSGWAEKKASLTKIMDLAEQKAAQYNLGALDALHIACALVSGVEELITTEKPTKPICRVTDLTRDKHLSSVSKPKKLLPEFADEQEEGRWYKAHRDEIDDYFEPLSEEEEKEFSEMLATLFPQKKVLNVEHVYQNQTVEDVFERAKRNWRG